MVGVVGALVLLLNGPQPRVAVAGGTLEQHEMVRWAVARFDAAGLTLPAIEIRFHLDRDSCHGRLGYFDDGVIDLCHRHTDYLASHGLLHEMAHGWVWANLDDARRERFLELRGLSTWNDRRVIWDERGSEHAAEIIAWAVGGQELGIRAPSIPNNEPGRLVEGYRLLTGDPLPVAAPWRGEG